MLAAEATVCNFIARINAHDAHGIVMLCTRDHCSIDNLGTRLVGLAAVEQAWVGYFALFPDYRIEVEAMTPAGELVMSSGWASATLRGTGHMWRIPAAWRATVAADRIAEWQVYAHNKPVYEILQQFPR